MKVPVGRIELVQRTYLDGKRKTYRIEVRKYPTDDTFEPVVSETDMSLTDIQLWLTRRGWFYAGHAGCVLNWSPKYGAPAIVMETEQTPLRYR